MIFPRSTSKHVMAQRIDLFRVISIGWVCLVWGVLFAGCKEQYRKVRADATEDDTVLTFAPVNGHDSANALQGNNMSELYNFSTVGGETIRVLASESSEKDPFFLAGDANYVVVAKCLDKKTMKTDTLLSNEFMYTQMDASSIVQKMEGNNHYLLLTAMEIFKGQAITEKTINFILVDVNSLEHYTLVYEGVSSIRCFECIDGRFQATSLLDKKPALKAILYEYAQKNKWIYQPLTPAEKDERHFINYEQKWNKDNQADNHLANGHSGVADPIYSTYYKDDIFQFTAAHAGATDSIENERYKIMSYWRGNILGFDKLKKLYFPVYIESCITGCDKKIKFISPEAIEIVYDEYNAKEQYLIRLDKIRFQN